jgi:hypothetical protein
MSIPAKLTLIVFAVAASCVMTKARCSLARGSPAGKIDPRRRKPDGETVPLR